MEEFIVLKAVTTLATLVQKYVLLGPPRAEQLNVTLLPILPI